MATRTEQPDTGLPHTGRMDDRFSYYLCYGNGDEGRWVWLSRQRGTWGPGIYLYFSSYKFYEPDRDDELAYGQLTGDGGYWFRLHPTVQALVDAKAPLPHIADALEEFHNREWEATAPVE